MGFDGPPPPTLHLNTAVTNTLFKMLKTKNTIHEWLLFKRGAYL